MLNELQIIQFIDHTNKMITLTLITLSCFQCINDVFDKVKFDLLMLGAIQIIHDTLGVWRVSQSVTKYHMGEGGWQKCHMAIFIGNFTCKC
jgi:hypothetical protein